MVRSTKKLQDFERTVLKEKSNVLRNFELMDHMYQEALELGVFPLKNPLEGLDVDIRIARIVNSV